MPDLLQENPSFRLIIIGEGPERTKLELKIKKLNLEKEVYLVGRVDHSQLPLYFKASDLFVLNTGYEGLPHIILEAIQSGLPVITTKIGGNPEVIKDGFNGILVDYNNSPQIKEAILRLWKDKPLQEKFIRNSLKVLEKFSLERMIEETLESLF